MRFSKWTLTSTLALLAAVPLAGTGCGDDDDRPATELCANDLDDDGDTLVDCDDSDCTGDPNCSLPPNEVDCDDLRDDDGDTLVDCDDDDCDLDPVCVPHEWICDDDIDNDDDGTTDCDDDDCASSSACRPTTETDCDDDIDDDGDTLVDCDDDDCDDDPLCTLEPETDCGDDVDNDGDTLVDCDDDDCAADPLCLPESLCADDVDNDGDTLVDCDDDDCAEDAACLESLCADDVDNDGDTLVDCDDDDCAADAACYEALCGDDVDNDGDTLVDCDDDDCAADPLCLPETVCDDGLDSDADGLTDCEDDDCEDAAACSPTGNETCATAFVLPDDPNGFWTGDTTGMTHDSAGTCQASSTAPDAVFEFSITEYSGFIADLSGSAFDTVMYLRESPCATGAEVECDDDDGAGTTSRIAVALEPGVYYLFVDGYLTNAGEYQLELSTFPLEVCDDGLDNDDDGDVDCDDVDCRWDAECVPAACVPDAHEDDDDVASATDVTTVPTDEYLSAINGDADYFAVDVCFGSVVTANVLFLHAGGNIDASLRRATDAVITSASSATDNERISWTSTLRGTVYLRVANGTTGSCNHYQLAVTVDDSACVLTETNCGDGTDNDGDGLIDCGDDDCAADARCIPETSCTNGIDDDADTLTDCYDPGCVPDPACTIAGNDTCTSAYALPDDPDGVWYGTTAGMIHDTVGTCATSATAPDVVYSFELTGRATVTAWLAGSAYDTVMYLRNTPCATGTSIACNDDNGSGGSWSRISTTLDPGTYFLFVDGYGTASGNYVLQVTTVLAEVCTGGIDEDGDTLIDCADPDCRTSPSCVELACGDTIDNDFDGFTDCDDVDCTWNAACTLPVCAEDAHEENDTAATATPLSSITPTEFLASVNGDLDYYSLSVCRNTVVTVDARFRHALGDLDVYLENLTGTSVASGTSSTDNESFSWTSNRTAPMVIRVRNYTSGSCNLYWLAASFNRTTEICTETLCGNSIDDDGDGTTDCADTDCAADAYCLPETSCTDGLDNDGDTLTDCYDPGCTPTAACTITGNDACASEHALPNDPTVRRTGSIATLTHTTSGTCGGSGRDAVFSFTLTARSTVVLSTQGTTYDTVLYVRAADCATGTQAGCNDDNGSGGTWSRLSLALDPGTYHVFLDAYSSTTTTGTWVLTTTTTPL
jgi:hypothetical protein